MSQPGLPSVRGRKRRVWAGLAGLFVAIHVALVLENIFTWAPTSDEPAHLAAGVVYGLTGEFDLYNVNPPLVRLVGAFPALLLMDVPPLSPQSDEYKDMRLEWRIGHDFFVKNSQSLTFLRGARLCSLTASVVTAVMILGWATRMAGRVGGLCALGLWCFSPTVISLASTFGADMPAATTILAAVLAIERMLKTRAWLNTLAAGLLLGIAFLTKFTALALTPMLVGCLIARRDLLAKQWWALTEHSALVIVLAVLVCNLGYGFRGTGTPLASFAFRSRLLAGDSSNGHSGNRFRGSCVGALPVPFPDVFLRGIDSQLWDFDRWGPTYFAGDWYDTRPVGVYWRVMLLKAPLGTLGLLAFVAFRMIAHLQMTWSCGGMRRSPGLWLSLLVIAGAVIGKPEICFVRYLLPAFPLAAIVLAGLCFRPPVMRGFSGGVISIGLLCNGLTVVAHHGEHLSYLSEAFGGSCRAHEWLIDGNIDWGQDVCKLKNWAMTEGITDQLHVSVVSPLTNSDWGFQAAPASEFHTNFASVDRAAHPGPTAGVFAVSVAYLESKDGGLKYLKSLRPKQRFGSIAVFEITPAESDQLRNDMDLAESNLSRSEPIP